MARIHLIFLLFVAAKKSFAEISTIPWSTNEDFTPTSKPEISAPKPGSSGKPLGELTTESIISLNAKKLFATRGNKNGFGSTLSALVTGQPPDARFMEALNEMMDKSGLGSGEMEINSTSNKDADEKPLLGDGSAEDMIRFLCSIFGGNTYTKDLIDKLKDIIDKIVSAFEVDCSPVVKASRALLSIIQCVFAGNADSALEQLYPFMGKHYKVLFREVHQFLNIQEKVALSYVESAKEAVRQCMTFVSNNKIIVDMVLNFVEVDDGQGADQFVEKNGVSYTNTKRYGKYSKNDNKSWNKGFNSYNNNRYLYQQRVPNFGLDDGSFDDNIDFSLTKETMDVITRSKQVIELFLNLLRGKRSMWETVSMGQKLVEAAAPLFRLNEKNAYVNRLVEFLDKTLGVVKDTAEADIKSGVAKIARDSAPLVAATRRFVQSGGTRVSASRMIDQIPACLDRVVLVVNGWDNKRYSNSRTYWA